MTIRTLEKLLLMVGVSLVGVYFFYHLAQNQELLDLSVPIMAAALFAIWLFFSHPQKQQ